MFSLVIPTYNRAAILERCIHSLLQLEGISNCEIIVVDDGSSDETPRVLAHLQEKTPDLIRVIRLTNGGPARARNHGVRAARYERILFVDDDVFPRQGMLQEHARMLDIGYTGSQGILLWHPEIRMTSLIKYIDSRGSQFAFDKVENDHNLDFRYIYTGNFAVLKAAVLEAGGFNETFTFSACEDTVLGYHLQQCGAKLGLNRQAIADHLHDISEPEFLRREYKVGYFIASLRSLFPAIAQELGVEQKDFLVGLQTRLLSILNSWPSLPGLIGYPASIRLRHREAFYKGFLQFKRKTADTAGGPTI